MQYIETSLPGLFEIVPKTFVDNRGSFSRLVDGNSSLSEHDSPYLCVSANPQAGTLRGMHFQAAPHCETKRVFCVAGRIQDVVIDLRPGSKTLGQWQSFILSAETYKGLQIPPMMAHGFLTLEPNTTVVYWIEGEFSAQHASGVVWNDAYLAINWKLHPTTISEKDSLLPAYQSLQL